MLRVVVLSFVVVVSLVAPRCSAQSVGNQSPVPSAPTGAQPAAKSYPSTPGPDPLEEATALYRRGEFDTAIEKYRQVLQEIPQSSAAYAGLTRVYLKKKDVANAYETVNKGLQAADAPVVRSALGEVYFRQGKIHEAETEWVGVVNSGHPDARTYLGLARVRWALSMYKGGQEMIEKAHQLDPADSEIHRLWILRQRREARIKYLEEYLASGENNDDAETRAGMRHYLDYLKARARDSRGGCRLVTKAVKTDVNLERLLIDPRHLRGYGLSVGINGKKSNLLLDTGASGIVISRGLAEKSGLTRISDTDVKGIGDKGNKPAYIGLADSLTVGSLEFKNCPVGVLEQRSVTGLDGVIGADIFSAFLVDLDFPHEKVHLGELPKRPDQSAAAITLQTDDDESDDYAESSQEESGTQGTSKTAAHHGPQDRYIAPEMKSFTQVFRFGHSLLVPTFIGDAPVKLFLLDTGAFNNIITPAAANEVTSVRGDSSTTVKGVSGSVKNVYRADKAALRFGHLKHENQEIIAFDMTNISDSLGTEVSGALGFAVLGMLDIKIDYRDGLVEFVYEPNR